MFPYRGKFHPQLVKAILNITGVQKSETVLDPMAGSGTACLEARSIGINSIGIDVSPFCTLMSDAKSVAMEIDPALLSATIGDTRSFVDFMSQRDSASRLPEIIYKKLTTSESTRTVRQMPITALTSSPLMTHN